MNPELNAKPLYTDEIERTPIELSAVGQDSQCKEHGGVLYMPWNVLD